MLTLVILSLFYLSPFVFSANTTSIVDLGYATYQGSLDPSTNVTAFLGLCYAAPPLGDLRWKAPQPPPTASSIQVADSAGNFCIQAGGGRSPTNPFRNSSSSFDTRAATESEDCLFLNVYVPGSLPSKRSLPVIVWIHGGGYVSGSGDAAGYDLVTGSNYGIVTVLIQYRLGLFGFLAGSEVKAKGQLNAGLLDQEYALKWVQQHISKFGGDPNKVTIWGLSAGAGSVLQHVVARNGETFPPLFRAAMTSSTFLPSQYAYDDPIPETLYNEVVSQSNCTSATDTLSCLRNADVAVLQAANNAIINAGFYGTFTFVPVIDGEFIVRRPTESMLLGRVNGEALLSVTNTNEGPGFVDPAMAATVNASGYAYRLFPKFGEKQAQEAGALYADTGTTIDQLGLIQGEAIFICPTYYLLHAFAGRSFKGQFAIPPALHSEDEVYYMPGGATPPFDNTDFIHAFSQAFFSFAISLNPNVKFDKSNITPYWNRFLLLNTQMLFNKTEEGQPDVRPIITGPALLKRCNFWQSVSELTSQ